MDDNRNDSKREVVNDLESCTPRAYSRTEETIRLPANKRAVRPVCVYDAL